MFLDWHSPLGSGAFGAVYNGTIKSQRASSGTLEVAVKTVNPSCSDAVTMRSFLSEIKVMSHLGKHKHIVSILGAYTKELCKGKVYIFLELCSLGSLEKYLRERIAKCTLISQNSNHSQEESCYEILQIM